MNPSNHPNDQEDLTVIEDLDPEEVRGRGIRFDLLLGIPLILAVVLFACWQWWHQDYQTSQYRAGQEAAGSNDLDSALHFYAEASGYGNADILVQSLREQIAERDSMYKSAVDFSAKDKWLNALRDIRAVAKIQPGYKDLLAREEDALDHVYTDALSGTVVQRAGANPPGLYLRNASGWTWLEESDAMSSVILISDDGNILYDVPGEGRASPSPTPASGEFTGIRSIFDENRAVAVAQPEGNGSRYTFRNMGVFLQDPTLAGKHGFWIFGPGSENNDDRANVIENSAYIYSRVVAYEPYSGEGGNLVDIGVTESLTTGVKIVDVDPDSDHYLLAEWSGTRSGSQLTGAILNLYLCTAGDEARQLVFSINGGGLQSAMLSPSGRFVLVHSYRNVEHEGEPWAETVTSLIDLQKGNKTRTLSEVFRNSSSRLEPQDRVSATFVRKGVFKGRLLLVNYDSGTSGGTGETAVANIRLLDPEKAMTSLEGENSLITANLPGIKAGNWVIVEQNDNELIIQAIGQYDDTTQTTGPTTLVRIDKTGQTETYTVEGQQNGGIFAVKTTDGRIAWSIIAFDNLRGLIGPVTQSVFTAQRPATGSQPIIGNISSTLVYTGTDGSEDTGEDTGEIVDFRRLWAKISLGDNLIGYTLDGSLHARTYDEDIDIMLETGVTAIWSGRDPALSALLR